MVSLSGQPLQSIGRTRKILVYGKVGNFLIALYLKIGFWNLILTFLCVVVAMSELTKAMCWKLVTIKKDKLNEVGAAIYQKPTTNECYNKRPQNDPPLCKDSDDQNAAW